MKKRLKICILLTFIVFTSMIFCPVKISAAEKVITFSDKNMYNAIKSVFNDKVISSDDSTMSITVAEEEIENTKSLHLSKSNIKDLSGIENFTNVEILDISGNHITSIEKIPSENLKMLSISYIDEIKDFNLIENYKSLFSICVDGSKLEDLPDSIKKISNQFTTFEWDDGMLKSTSWVKDFPKIRTLRLINNKINSLENLSTLKELGILDLSGNEIENIDEIGKCTQLSSLYINDNLITNLNGISNIALKYLDIANNRLTDISGLNVGQLISLDVSNNSISDFDIIKDVAVDKKFDISGQLIKIDVNSGDKVKIPPIVNQGKNFLGVTDIETTNCKIEDESKCAIDESVTYARIKINDGALKNSLIYFNVNNVQAPGVTDKTVNFTKTQIVVICEVLFIMVISVFIIANIKNKSNKKSKQGIKSIDTKNDNSDKTNQKTKDKE